MHEHQRQGGKEKERRDIVGAQVPEIFLRYGETSELLAVAEAVP